MTTEFGKITIQGSLALPDYEREVTEILRDIAGNPVGRVVLSFINENATLQRRLTIKPFWEGVCNADAGTSNRLGLSDSVPKGVHPYSNLSNVEGAPYDARYQFTPVVGTGLGANATVQFTKNTWGASTINSEHKISECAHGLWGTQPDEALLHELVHAVRIMYALVVNRPTLAALKHFKNDEEFWAITIANVYMSAKVPPVTQLRKGWIGFEAMDPALSTSAGFLTNAHHVLLLAELRVRWPAMFDALVPIDVRFNPFRQFALNVRSNSK